MLEKEEKICAHLYSVGRQKEKNNKTRNVTKKLREVPAAESRLVSAQLDSNSYFLCQSLAQSLSLSLLHQKHFLNSQKA